jgi:hypothetical protein
MASELGFAGVLSLMYHVGMFVDADGIYHLYYQCMRLPHEVPLKCLLT